MNNLTPVFACSQSGAIAAAWQLRLLLLLLLLLQLHYKPRHRSSVDARDGMLMPARPCQTSSSALPILHSIFFKVCLFNLYLFRLFIFCKTLPTCSAAVPRKGIYFLFFGSSILLWIVLRSLEGQQFAFGYLQCSNVGINQVWLAFFLNLASIGHPRCRRNWQPLLLSAARVPGSLDGWNLQIFQICAKHFLFWSFFCLVIISSLYWTSMYKNSTNLYTIWAMYYKLSNYKMELKDN